MVIVELKGQADQVGYWILGFLGDLGLVAGFIIAFCKGRSGCNQP